MLTEKNTYEYILIIVLSFTNRVLEIEMIFPDRYHENEGSKFFASITTNTLRIDFTIFIKKHGKSSSQSIMYLINVKINLKTDQTTIETD